MFSLRVAKEQRGARKKALQVHHAHYHVLQHLKKAGNASVSTESNRQVVKHTTHRIERDSYKNHEDNFSWFWRRSFHKKKEQINPLAVSWL